MACKIRPLGFSITADDLVFANEVGRWLNAGDVTQRFYAALKRAGLNHKRSEDPPICVHDLRPHVRNARSIGRPLAGLRGRLDGNADTKTTEIYAHYAPAANEAEGLNFLIAGTGTRAVGVV